MSLEAGNDQQLELYIRQWGRLQRSVATLAIAGGESQPEHQEVDFDTVQENVALQDARRTNTTFETPQQDSENGIKYTPVAPISREEFNGHSALSGLSKSVQSRYWHIGGALERHQLYRLYSYKQDSGRPRRIELEAGTTDLKLILSAMRGMESGDERLSYLGEGSWNVYTSLINNRLAESPFAPPPMLAWQPGLHTKLRSWVAERRYEAAEQIADLYRQLEIAFEAFNKR